jgi:hypothetical protein
VFKITNNWLKEHATQNGGYTRDQLELLGLEYPPHKGWKKDMIDLSITDSTKLDFELGKYIKAETDKLAPIKRDIYKLSAIDRDRIRAFINALPLTTN